ncbi:MAG: sigma-70 family RNA polymerase sigma factor [Planctomycetota bacterium]
MMSKSKNRVRFPKGHQVTLAELDQVLDVKVQDFERTVARLVREFRTKDISISVPRGSEDIALDPLDSRVSWTGLFDVQVQRLARNDRAEEFRMAKRYEFMRARAVAALRELGFPEDEANGLVLLGRGLIPPPPQRVKPALLDECDRSLAELEALRNRYVEGALYLVPMCAQRYRNYGLDGTDLIQEGCASLFQAIEGFDWRREVRFKTYGQYWIHQAMLKALYNASRTVRVPVWVQKALSKIRKVRDAGRTTDGQEMPDELVGETLGMTGTRVRELLDTKRYAVSLDVEVGDADGASLGQLLPDDRLAPVFEVVEDGDLGKCLDELMSDLPSREQLILTRRYGLHGHEPETLGEIAADLGITAERVRQLQKAALTRLQRPAKVQRLKAYAG